MVNYSVDWKMVATTEDKKKYKLTHKQVDKTVDSPCMQGLHV